MKRVFVLLIAISLFSSVAAHAFEDVGWEDPLTSILSRQVTLGIINGYGDGSFRPDNEVTRSEFIKIIIQVLQIDKDASYHAGTNLYSDIPDNYWASGYIGLAVKQGLVNGYADGAFRPNNPVTYAEGLTIAVRSLGYTAEDVGYHWPTSFVDKARALKLIDKMVFNHNDVMTRRTVAYLLDAMLETELPTGVAAGTKLKDTFKYKTIEDLVIYADKTISPSLAYNEVATTRGTFKFESSFNITEYIGLRADIVIDNENYITEIKPYGQTSSRIVIQNVFGNDWTYAENGETRTEKMDDNMVVYDKASVTVLSALRSKLTEGQELVLYKNAGDTMVDYAFLYEFDMQGPHTIASATPDEWPGEARGYFSGVSAQTKVLRDGLTTDIFALQLHDVVYYVEKTDTLYAYCDTFTGFYDQAMPNKTLPTSIIVSGVEYTLGTKQATSRVDSSDGAFAYDDKITLLLGRDGTVVDVVNEDNVHAVMSYGVVLDTYHELSDREGEKGKLYYYATILKMDDTTVNYKTDSNYVDFKGDLVKLDYSGGQASLSRLNRNRLTGELNVANKTLDGHWFTDDHKVVELISNASNNPASAQIIKLSDIYAEKLYPEDVLNVVYGNEFEDIMILFVDGVSNSRYEYGILTKFSNNTAGMNISGTYEVTSAGVEKTYRTSVAYTNVRVGQGVGVEVLRDGTVNSIIALTEVGNGRSVSAISEDRIKISGTVYRMASNVQYYKAVSSKKHSGYDYVQISKEETQSTEYSAIRLYADKSVTLGGVVRIVVVN